MAPFGKLFDDLFAECRQVPRPEAGNQPAVGDHFLIELIEHLRTGVA